LAGVFAATVDAAKSLFGCTASMDRRFEPSKAIFQLAKSKDFPT
jgi:hypothetical protein